MSIIIPIFNVEKYIKNTIDCIINQTIGFENIELILVDDKSKDNSRKIIQDYADKYENIKPVFLEKNSGAPSHPRNVGIENVTSPYMLFLDSDDEIFEDYCEILYETIINNDTDIVHCVYSSKLNDKIYIPSSIEEINYDTEIIDNDEKPFLNLTAWGNIFSTDLILKNNIRFSDSLYEDGTFSLICFLKTDKPIIKLYNYPGYIYLIENSDSFTHKVSLKTLEGFLNGFLECDFILKEYGREDSRDFIFNSLMQMAIFLLVKLDDLDVGIQKVYDFENTLDFKITLNSKPLNLINNKIMKKQFKQAKFLIKAMGLFYNNKKIRNYYFIKFTNLKLKV